MMLGGLLRVRKFSLHVENSVSVRSLQFIIGGNCLSVVISKVLVVYSFILSDEGKQ